MIKTLLALTVLFAATHSQAQTAAPQSRQVATQAVTVTVESITPLENAFDITVRGGAIYHLENAARMTIGKMNALNNSLDNSAPVTLRVEGKEILDILLQ